MKTESCQIPRRPPAQSIYAALALALGVLPIAAKADPTLEARGTVVAVSVGTSDDLLLHNATSADSVTRSESIADSSIPGLSGTAQVTGTATFGALSGSGSATAAGATANSIFQAQPLAAAQDYVTILAGGPVALTLHYAFSASTTAPNDQRGSIDAQVEAVVNFYPSGFVENSEIMSKDLFFIAGNETTPPGAVLAGDASHGATYSITGSMTEMVDPGETYGLYGSFGLWGEDQNLNGDGHELDIAAAGSFSYWVTFDSSDAQLTSESGATYGAPGAGSSVPEGFPTLPLLGFGMGMLGLATRRRRPQAA